MWIRFPPSAPILMNIFINKKVWDKFTPEQMLSYKEEVFKYYREHGFPHYDLNRDQIKKEYDKLKNFDLDTIIEGDVIRQTMHGLALCWNFHPYAFEIPCNGLRTPSAAFSDDRLLRMAINKRIQYGTFMTQAGMRKSLRSMSGVQAVSNFRPSAAAAIYRKFGGGKVYDPSAGFGGRMLGALASGVVSSYIGTDPSTKAINGNVKLAKTLNESMKILLLERGSETYIPKAESLDICFTSPPYHNTERYSDEETQSYIAYPTKDLWLRGYLQKTLENCYTGLKKDGWLLINIANVKSFPDLTEKFLELADRVGFRYQYEMKYQLSRIMGTKHKGNFKSEPLFCFKK